MDRPEILDAARRCVCGDREEDYGSPEQNFQTISYFWQAYLIAAPRVIVDGQLIDPKDHDIDIVIDPYDVAAMQALLKIGRIAGGQAKMDNWIDAAGYSACGGELQSRLNNKSEE